MTNYNGRLDDILSKTPCIQCDGSGTYPDYDGEPVQCQFCWQLRLTFIDGAEQAIQSLIRTEKLKLLDRLSSHQEDLFWWTGGEYEKTKAVDMRAIAAERELLNKLKEEL